MGDGGESSGCSESEADESGRCSVFFSSEEADKVSEAMQRNTEGSGSHLGEGVREWKECPVVFESVSISNSVGHPNGGI
jgi:hypothetical protein